MRNEVKVLLNHLRMLFLGARDTLQRLAINTVEVKQRTRPNEREQSMFCTKKEIAHNKNVLADLLLRCNGVERTFDCVAD